MSKQEAKIPQDRLALYEKLVATNPTVERKGDSMPYTSLNGHMFSFLTKTGTLALRLPADERDKFLEKYKTKSCEQHGTVMKEYVEVPDGLLKKTRELKNYFDLSFAYVGSLKPKATKKSPRKTATKTTAKKTVKKATSKKRRKGGIVDCWLTLEDVFGALLESGNSCETRYENP